MATGPHTAHRAWPFAITRSVKTGFQIVVAPDFLAESGQHHLLADAAGGEVSEELVYRREYRDRGSDRLWLLYRVVYLKGDDVGQADGFDRQDRRTPLIEGVVCRARPEFSTTDELFTRVHELCAPKVRAFYLEDTETFPVHRCRPVEPPETGRRLRIEDQDPYDSGRNLQAALRGRRPPSRLPVITVPDGAVRGTGLDGPGGPGSGRPCPVPHRTGTGPGGQDSGQGHGGGAGAGADGDGGRREGRPAPLIAALAAGWVAFTVLLAVLLAGGFPC